MQLLNILGHAQIAAFHLRASTTRRLALRHAAETLFHHFDKGFMLDTPRTHDHQIAGVVMLAHVIDHLVPRQLGDDFLRTQNRSADALMRKGKLVHEVEHIIFRCIEIATDFLDDNLALAIQLAFVEQRMAQHVGDDIDGKLGIFRQHARVIGGFLARGMRVHGAAVAFDIGGKGKGRTLARAFEHHMFDEMRNTIGGPRFVARTDANPGTDHRAFRLAHRVRCYAQPVGEGGDLDGGHGGHFKGLSASKTGQISAQLYYKNIIDTSIIGRLRGLSVA